MGSFCPVAGNLHLHRYFNFTGSLVETVPKSLHLSCGSELRTVIVTAAVHWGFGRMLWLPGHPSLTFQHWAGVSTYTSAFALAGTCVCGKQSLGPLLCDRLQLQRQAPSPRRLPLSRSYGYILPSSLTRVLPRTLGFSPRIPVSVYGTGGSSLTRSFSRQCGISSFARISARSA